MEGYLTFFTLCSGLDLDTLRRDCGHCMLLRDSHIWHITVVLEADVVDVVKGCRFQDISLIFALVSTAQMANSRQSLSTKILCNSGQTQS
jgi:hypothetical protein